MEPARGPRRPLLAVHVFGSEGSGKETLRTQWLESTHAAVLSEVADVCFVVELDTPREGTAPTARTVIVLYRLDDQSSIVKAEESLRAVHTNDTLKGSATFVIENHLEEVFEGGHLEVSDLPETLQGVIGAISLNHEDVCDMAVKCWALKVSDGVQVAGLLHQAIITPALSLLSAEDKTKLISVACRDGKVQVLKLLLTTVGDTDPSVWLNLAMANLEQEGVLGAQSPALLEVARFAYNLDPTFCQSAIVRLAEKYPHSSLILLHELCGQHGHSENHFIKSGLSLISLPSSWIQNPKITFIDLSGNLLSSVPDDLFKLPQLTQLNISHNRIASIPSILVWNCPLLRSLDLSHNKLADTPYELLVQQPGVSPEQKKTGFNLHARVRSLTTVTISHNTLLTNVPEWVCLLPNLNILEMTGLPSLSTLTPYLSHCRYMCVLQVDKDRLKSPPPEVVQEGTRTIMAYLRCKLRGSSPYRHVKVIVMGDKGCGKSTLFAQMVNSKNKGGLDTMLEGTVVYPAKSHRDRPKTTFHVMQLSSEDVLSCTHSCLLTYRSIFVCLWNVVEGRGALKGLVTWLRMIQACVPGSPTIVAATHMDKVSGLDPATIVEWLNAELGDIHQLQSAHLAAKYGFPPLVNVVTMTCSNPGDIELLMEDLYKFSSLLRRPGRKEAVTEEQIPRLYLELQNLIEMKVRAMKTERPYVPVMNHEEFSDYVRSLTFQYDDLEEGQEEFALACRFLHDAGTIVHYQSPIAGMSDLYFLDLQWLANRLATIILAQMGQRSGVGGALVSSQRLSILFQVAEMPSYLYSGFMTLMESYDIMVSLNMERTNFLFPSLLPQAPPPQYPPYDLSAEQLLVHYISMTYLPNGFFSRLLSRIVTYIRQLSGQLLATSSTPLLPDDKEEEEVDGAMVAGKLFHHGPRTLYLDKRGYVCQRDGAGEEDELSLRQKIWALTLSMLGSSGTRYRSLTEKLLTLSEPVLRQQSTADVQQGGGPGTISNEFSSCVIWQRGLFAAFPQGAKFWLEVCMDGLVLLVGGAPLQKVKVLSFIVSCVTALAEEHYRGLGVVPLSPCPTCLTRYWSQSDKGTGKRLSFAQSYLEPTTIAAVEDFVHSSPPKSANRRRLIRHSRVEAEVEGEGILFLGNEVPMFPVSLAVQDRSSKSVLCALCCTDVTWKDVAPNVLLLDFADRLLLKPTLLQVSEDNASLLGRGGFGKVLKGMYNGSAVAVKVFQPTGAPGAPAITPQWCYLALREELSIAGHLNHPRIAPLVGVCLRPLCMVMQLAPQGSLSKHLALCPSGLDPMVTHEVLLQIADGLQYLHSLYIVHRDIKASNVLVWGLHPQHGVDVRLSDYGTSQFSMPLGLKGTKGTEEYMAPECFKKKMSYDEKVDIFSLGLLLFHLVTGRRLYTSNVLNNTGPSHSGSSTKCPSLSAALSSSFSEQQHSAGAEHSVGVHQAARREPLTSCYAVCMQPLLEGCLALEPCDRPTAQGVYSRLVVCPGSLPQANFITAEVKKAIYVPSTGVVLGQAADSNKMLEIAPVSWTAQTRMLHLPCQNEAVSCFVCAEEEMYLCSESGLVSSLSLPHLSSGLIASSPLPSGPLTIFTHPDKMGTRILVGLANGMVAVYTPRGSQHPLKSEPKMVVLFDHPDLARVAVHCAIYHEGMLWCGCGRHLIVVRPSDYELLHMRPASSDSTYVTHLVASGRYVWAGLHDSCELAVFCSMTATEGKSVTKVDQIKCSDLLGLSSENLYLANVTELTSSGDVVWVGTQGGHLLAFHSPTQSLLTVQHHHGNISTLVMHDMDHLVTFGTNQFEDDSHSFTVWRVFSKYMHSLK